MPLAIRLPKLAQAALKVGVPALPPLLAMTSPAQAYIGPGAGLTAIGTAVALVSALFLAMVGFIVYPVRRLLRKRRGAAGPAPASGTPSADPSADAKGDG